MNWLSSLAKFFFLLIPILSWGQSWKSIPNQTYGIAIQYKKVYTDKWGKNHVFIGFRRGNSNKGVNNPMVYIQVESKKVQIFDMKDGILDPPQYDSTLDLFFGINRQPMLIWKLIPGKDSAQLVFLTTKENRVNDQSCFSWRKERDGFYYGTTSSNGRFFRFSPLTGKIENLGQSEVFDNATPLRRTGFHFAVTPKGWAMNYRDDHHGGYYIYYQDFEGKNKYTVFLGKDQSPANIAVAKSGQEVIAVRTINENKKYEWLILDPSGKKIVDQSIKYPNDFWVSTPQKQESKIFISQCSVLGGTGKCRISVNGKSHEFEFKLPVDLQKMEYVTHDSRLGWIGTKGTYQELFLLDSFPESSLFSIANEGISTYFLGGKENLYVAGYPSGVSVWKDDSLRNIIANNSYPKYFISLIEKGPYVFILGKHDRDRTGFEVWRWHTQTQSLDQPWEKELDSLFQKEKGEALFFVNNQLLLTTKSNSSNELHIFELLEGRIKSITLPKEIQALQGKFSFAFHPNKGLFAAWSSDSIWIGSIPSSSLLGFMKVNLIQKEKNHPNKSNLAFTSNDQLIISGWDEKNKKGEVQLVNWKKKRRTVLKSDAEPPRLFASRGMNQFLFFGGSSEQNKNFDVLTLPNKLK